MSRARIGLSVLAEHIQAIRALLAGESVSIAGDYVRLDGVRLDHPPAHAPPVLAGVRGPRSLELSGRIADGTILAWPLTGPYIAQARQAIEQGRLTAGRSDRAPAGRRHADQHRSRPQTCP